MKLATPAECYSLSMLQRDRCTLHGLLGTGSLQSAGRSSSGLLESKHTHTRASNDNIHATAPLTTSSLCRLHPHCFRHQSVKILTVFTLPLCLSQINIFLPSRLCLNWISGLLAYFTTTLLYTLLLKALCF